MRLAMLVGAMAAAGLVLVASSAKADPTPTGIEVGLRSGYAIPLGAAVGGGTNGSNDLSKVINGAVPIWVDAGYRFSPNMMIGAFFQYGIGFVNKNGVLASECTASGVSCSASDIKIGVQFQYHLMPDQTVDPWGGIGVGYEIGKLSASDSGQSASETFNGFQFVNLQLGADYKAMPNLGIGPFVDFSLGEYSSCSDSSSVGGTSASGSCTIQQTALHEWLTVGLRGVYDINL